MKSLSAAGLAVFLTLCTVRTAAGSEESLAGEVLRAREAARAEGQIIRAALVIARRAAVDRGAESFDLAPYVDQVETLAREAARRVSAHAEPAERLAALNRYFFEEQGFRADGDDPAGADPENILIHRVLDRRRGACVALSLLYMHLARTAGLDVSGVAAPSHFFLRYDDGKRFNIEMLEEGRLYDDDRPFMERLYIRPGEPFYLESLGPEETFGVYLNNLGALYNATGHGAEAAIILEAAREINPEDVEVITNLGNALAIQGRTVEAVRLWQAAVGHNRYDDKAHYNLALVYYQDGNYAEAIHHYDQSLLLGHNVNFPLLRALEPHREDSLVNRDAALQKEED